ncbi:cysteine--tRNA ligase, partial [Rhodovulum sulfidophilum]|nr:cysteine--tRNA ligase [Rhodovulum sulfidophilum]
KASAGLLGLLGEDMGVWAEMPEADLGGWTERLAAARAAAMDSKDFSEVDRLKALLIDAGVEVRMSKAGVELLPGAGFDQARLEGSE